MAKSLGYSLAILLCIVSASFHVFGDSNSADPLDGCQSVTAKLPKEKLVGCLECIKAVDRNNQSCFFVEYITPRPSMVCDDHSKQAPKGSSFNESDCKREYGPDVSTTVAPTTVSPPNSTTTTTSTEKPTTVAPTNGTSPNPPPTPTPTPVTNGTTPSPTPTPSPVPANGTTSVPSGSTTAGPTVKPTSAPSGGGGGFSFATFLGGIVFTLAVSALAYVAFRFYKARTSRYNHLGAHLF